VIGYAKAIVVFFVRHLPREQHVLVGFGTSSGISNEIEKGIGMGIFVDEVGFSIESANASESHHPDPDVQVEEVGTIVSFPSP